MADNDGGGVHNDDCPISHDEQSNVINLNHRSGDKLHRAGLDLYDDIVTEHIEYDEYSGDIVAIDHDGFAASCVQYLRRFAHERPDAYLGATGRHPSYGVDRP